MTPERSVPRTAAGRALLDWLWRRLPLRVRSHWSPRDNWQRGYLAGMEAGLERAESRAARGERIR